MNQLSAQTLLRSFWSHLESVKPMMQEKCKDGDSWHLETCSHFVEYLKQTCEAAGNKEHEDFSVSISGIPVVLSDRMPCGTVVPVITRATSSLKCVEVKVQL